MRVILLAVTLRYTNKFLLTQSSQFSHKQLVLVATPVSTGVYFFTSSLVATTKPTILPIVSAIISPISKERLGMKYFCTYSIAIPYTHPPRVTQTNNCCTDFKIFFSALIARHQRKTKTEKRPICTHLSNQILFNQVSWGKAEPGSVSKMVQIINHPIAKRRNRFLFKQ